MDAHFDRRKVCMCFMSYSFIICVNKLFDSIKIVSFIDTVKSSTGVFLE